MQSIFTKKDTWTGGFYELAMELGPEPDQRLEPALRAIWQTPDLDGCYLRPDVEPEQQQRVQPSLESTREFGHLRGLAIVPGGHTVACGSLVIEEKAGPVWLLFYIPMGSLGTAYPVKAFPFDAVSESRVWREPLDKWLAAIGDRVYTQAHFRLGLVGHEVSADADLRTLAEQGPPGERWVGYLLPKGDRLDWLAPNQWQEPQSGKPVSVTSRD